jgi:filamentous hemagglutinin family protein
MTATFRSVPSRLRALRPLALAAASLCAGGGLQAAGPVLPAGLQVVQGQATVQTQGRQLTVTNTAGALLNWQQFSIGAGDAVRFVQPSVSSKVLNRVVGQDPSQILGSLSSNGQVWLLNPNGVLFGHSARVDVAGLVASTLRLDDDAWRAGLATGRFSLGGSASGAAGGTLSAAVVNQGELRSTSGGRVLLIGGAGGVRNEGLIEAPDGQVVLAAGTRVDLVDTATPRLGLQLSAPQGEVLNLGRLSAGGGFIDLQAALVNQQGIVRADSLGQGVGGQVLISASQGATLGAASRTSADGAGAGGQVVVDAGGGTLLASGGISALGGNGAGGSIGLLGRQVGLLDGALADASGATGGGAVRVGGGLRGADPAWRHADATFMAPGATVRADALRNGDGGLVVLWGNQATRAYGSLSARGGALGGNGGFIETSGGWIDVRPRAVDTGAPAGRAGQWLIDPDDLLVSSSVEGDFDISGGPNFITTGDPATLSTFTISQALNANNNVTIATSNSPGNEGNGDITLRGAFFNVAPTQAVSLTFNAAGSVLVEDSSIQTLNAPLTVNLVAGALGGVVGRGDGSGYGGGIRIQSSSIATAGGDITLGGPSVACGAVLGCTAGNTGAVAHSGSSVQDGVSIRGSTLRAGLGRVQIDGHSLISFTDTAGVRITDGSQIEGSRVSIRGTVDAGPAGYSSERVGVLVANSGIAATESLRITGSVYGSQATAGNDLAPAVDIGHNSLLRVGQSGASQPADGEPPGMVIRGMSGGASDNSAARTAVYIGDDGTRLVALGGAGIDIRGDVETPGLHRGIVVGGGSVEIDASAGSALTLRSGNDLLLSGRIQAPAGGSLSLAALGDLFIGDALVDGAPATVSISGNTVSIGAGASTRLVFNSDALVSVQASTLLLGVPSIDAGLNGALDQTQAGGPGRQQALSIKRALATATLPDLTAATVLATGGRLEVAADNLLLGDGLVLSAGATGNALRITGTQGGAVQSFVNLGDGSVFRTPAGHWRVELADSTDDNEFQIFRPGGLRADFWQYGAMPGTAPAAPGNGFLFAATPVVGLQPTSASVLPKAYDGSVNVNLAALNLAVSGLRDGQSLGGGLTLQDRRAGEARSLVPSQGSLGNTVVAGDGTPIFGYAFDMATLQVSVAPLTLNLSGVLAASKVYDGGSAAGITRWTLSGLLEGDSVTVASGTASFSDANVGTGKSVAARVAALGGPDAGNYRLGSSTATTTADITPAALLYRADGQTVVRGATLPALTGTVQGLVSGETLATATQGQLLFQTTATSQSDAGRYAVNGSGLTAQNYVFSQATSNASALAITLPPVEVPATREPVNTLVTLAAVAAVLPTAEGSAAGSGRALDALPGLQGDNRSGSFGTLDLDNLPGATVASVLAARDAYKKTVFRDALTELATNPAAADAAGCTTAQQAASGQCLVVRPLGAGLDISNARVVERAAVTAPSAAAPAAPGAAAAPGTAPAPVPTPTAAPSAALRVQPLPADLQVNLPARRTVARAAVPQIRRKIAVLIGVDNYLDGRIPKLANAVSDVRAVSSTLAQSLGYETVVLENPGKATIFRTLNQLAAQVGPNDSVVVYYAGHGERVEKTGLGYWQPADADASRPETWISNADIDRLLRQLPAQQLAMVSDSCYSGSLVSGERIRGAATTADAASLLNKRAVAVMTSGGNEPVFDSGLNGHSPFAWNLMQSLQQVGGWKPGSNLFEQVRFAVARKLPQRPQYGASRGGGHEPGADYLFEQRQLDAR